MQCESCVTDKSKCINCCDNPIYAHVPKRSQFTWYKSACHLGFIECIYDPGYTKATNPKLYEKLYGNVDPEVAEKSACKTCTMDNCFYDYEDK